MPFCPKCGKRIKDDEEFCSECIKEIKPLSKSISGTTHILICKNCRAIFLDKKWGPIKELKGLIVFELAKTLKPAPNTKIEILTPIISIISALKKNEKEIPVQIELKQEDRAEKETVKIKPLYRFCKTCLMKKTDYFQGILQLRNVGKDVIDFVFDFFEKSRFPDQFIAKIAELNNGIDFYISMKKYIFPVAKELKKKFGGAVKTSKKLMTRDRQTGKEVYRIFVLFEGLNIKRGAIITVDENVYEIVELGTPVKIKNLRTGKTKPLDLSVSEWEELNPVEVQIIQTHPKPYVLDPETYQNTELVIAPRHKIRESIMDEKTKNANAVFYNSKAYLVG